MLPEIDPEITRRLQGYKTIDDFRNDVSRFNLNSFFGFSKVYCVFRLDFRAKMDFISQLCQFWSADFKKVRYHFFLPRYQ
jgi:hypothetical protein